jgi:hypothetical protein
MTAIRQSLDNLRAGQAAAQKRQIESFAAELASLRVENAQLTNLVAFLVTVLTDVGIIDANLDVPDTATQVERQV